MPTSGSGDDCCRGAIRRMGTRDSSRIRQAPASLGSHRRRHRDETATEDSAIAGSTPSKLSPVSPHTVRTALVGVSNTRNCPWTKNRYGTEPVQGPRSGLPDGWSYDEGPVQRNHSRAGTRQSVRQQFADDTASHLCIGCFQQQLGRTLTAADFSDRDVNVTAQRSD
jgi:hypothetical protein